MRVHSANFIPDDHQAWRARNHSNPNWQLILVQGHDLRFQRDRARLSLRHGQMLILHPNELHSSWGDQSTSSGFYYVQFSPAHRASGVKPLEKPSSNRTEIALPMLGEVNNHKVFDLFAELVQEMHDRPAFYEANTTGIFIQLIVHFARHTIPFDSDFKPLFVRSPRQADIVSRVKKFLEHHYREQLTSKEIASYFGYNYAHLSRLFKQATHMTITEYVQHLRIEEARILLLELNKYQSIRDIANYVGYTDASYFNRVFRKIEGVSPSTFVRNAYGPVRRSLKKDKKPRLRMTDARST